MMKKSMAILAVAVMMLTPVILADMDMDAANVQKCRFSQEDLYHCEGTALYNDMVKEGIWVYPIGKDSKMKAYIADPQNAPRPDKGVSEIIEGETYDIYCFSGPEQFEYTSLQKVLEKYSKEFFVQDRTVEKLTVTSLKDSYGDFPVFVVEYHGGDAKLSQYYSVGSTASLNHYKDGGHYELSTNRVSMDLFVEAEYEISVKEFTGSPYLYIGLCIGITAAIALLIFWCGRKPKL